MVIVFFVMILLLLFTISIKCIFAFHNKLFMETGSTNVSPDCLIVNSRIVNAPQELVFRAWTEPNLIAKWWGPAGFTNTILEHDLRPGGKWSFIMHGPEKGNYANECVFLEIIKPSFISWKRLSQPLFNIAASFDKISDETTNVTFRMIFATKEECDKVRGFAGEKNEENLDKLELELDRLKEAGE